MRTPSLTQLMVKGVAPSVAVRHADLVRAVRIDRPEQVADIPALRQCRELRRVEVTYSANLERFPRVFSRFEKLMDLRIESYEIRSIPEGIGKLENLRQFWLSRAAHVKRLPKALWSLPRLEELRLFHTGIRSLGAFQGSKTLKGLSCFDTPVPDDEQDDARALAEKNAGRAPRFARSKRRLAALIRAEALPLETTIEGVDLAGQHFEDVVFTADFDGCDLRGARFERCVFNRAFTRCKLDDAHFIESVAAHFGTLDFGRSSAKKTVFERCGFGARFEKGKLRGASFLGHGPDAFIDLTGANARDVSIEAEFTTPKNGHYVKGPGADLRGASVTLRLTDEVQAQLRARPAPVRWKKPDFSEATTDDATRVTMEKFARAKAPSGPQAEAIGRLSAINAGLWCVVADAAVARAWDGSEVDANYEPLPGSDFARALEISQGAIAVGDGEGLVVSVGGCGTSRIWRTEEDIRLLEYYEGDVDSDAPEGIAAVGKAVLTLDAESRKRVGSVEVTSGCLALLLPYTKATYSAKDVRAAAKKKSATKKNGGDQALVPVADGRYDVFHETLNQDDEVGMFCARVCIVPAGRAESAKSRRKKTAGKRGTRVSKKRG